MSEDDRSQTARIWNRKVDNPKVPDRFWLFPQITSHANARVCGKAVPGVANGLRLKLKEIGPFGLAVSIGCGLAGKELNLLLHKIVGHFDLFDFADARLAKAKQAYVDKGLADHATFRCEDALASQPNEKYDLIYWSSSLHHMTNAHAAVEWSWNALKPNGVFAMYEFIGPSRFQWSDQNLDYVRRFRSALPAPLATAQSSELTRRPTVEEMIARDPSEAADSSNIIPAVRDYFPEAEITYLGGALYHFGLNGIYPRIGPEDGWVFDQALLVDDLLSELGMNHFAIAIGRKPTVNAKST